MDLFGKKNITLKLDRKIYLVFIIVVLIALSNAIISAITIRNSKKIAYTISLVINPTLDKLEEMNLLVTRSRMLITNWVYLPSNVTDKDSLLFLNRIMFPNLKASVTKLMVSWNSPANESQMNSILRDYDELIIYEKKITGILARFDDYQDPMKKFASEELIENEIIPRSNAIMIQLKNLIASKKQEAAAMQALMIDSYFYLLVMILGLAVIIILSVLMAGGYMVKKVIIPIMKIREVIIQMSKGELPDFNLRFTYNALGEMSYAIRQLIEGLKRTAHFAGEIGKGNFNKHFELLSEKDILGGALLEMRSKLALAADSDTARNWANEGIAKLGSILHKNTESMELLCDEIISNLVVYVEAQQGAVYLINTEKENNPFIELTSFYGLNGPLQAHPRIEMREGLLGQAISSNKRIYIPALANPEYIIQSGLIKTQSCFVLIVPLQARGTVLGAIEIVSTTELSQIKIDFISQFAEPVAGNIFSIKSFLVTKKLLIESQKQAEDMAAQDQELRQINNELTSQSQLLKLSEEELKSQQEELKKMNAELEVKAILLEEKNLTIEDARQSIAFKAEQLEKSNKFKSAFLANMSHELRTPLNSVLILAKLLADNKEKNLTERQTEFAEVIHKSGSDLLFLINDILDLSKIESGKIELTPVNISLETIISDLHNLFRELAREKGITFQINKSPNLPENIFTDQMRLDQILKNLLSNAFKFTPKNGTVILSVELAKPDLIFKNQQLFAAKNVISISVIDTGIGIPENKHSLIFEAFKQADGSTSRKYGGTGLGLAISKELAIMLGGDLVVNSKEGAGSTFTVHLPDQYKGLTPEVNESIISEPNENSELKIKLKETYAERKSPELYDERQLIKLNEPRILIIEDDLSFCKTLKDLANAHKLKTITASQGDTGLDYAIEYIPNAILLDMQLPVMDGWTVLKKLKENNTLKHIPVYIISGMEKQKLGLELGAAGYILKPARLEELDMIFSTIASQIHNHHPRILLVENRKKELDEIIRHLKELDKVANLCTVENLEECLHNMQLEKYDRIFVNSSFAGTPDERELISTIEAESKKSGSYFLLYDEKNLETEHEWNQVFNNAHSESFPNQKDKLVTDSESRMLQHSAITPDMPDLLREKVVLLTDDDMRNIYALTSILEEEGMQVICAFDGKDALEKLKANPGIQLVLMDIMMPEMDGYEAINQLRKNPAWARLPVIALTAKAMQHDREKCLLAGASDYLTKPINIEQLKSLMKVWLYQE